MYIETLVDKWKPKKAKKPGLHSYMKYEDYVDEIICVMGELYIFVGMMDDFDDYSYILIDKIGRVSYHSAVGAIDFCLKDCMTKKGYETFKSYFYTQAKKQSDWRRGFSKESIINFPEHFTVKQYVVDSMPLIETRVEKIERFKNPKLDKYERKIIRRDLFKHIMHMLGWHHSYNITYLFDQIKHCNDVSIPYDDSVATIYCDVCKKTYKVRDKKFKYRNWNKSSKWWIADLFYFTRLWIYSKIYMFRHEYWRETK